jgi:hypothetical protein
MAEVQLTKVVQLPDLDGQECELVVRELELLEARGEDLDRPRDLGQAIPGQIELAERSPEPGVKHLGRYLWEGVW